MAAKWEILCGVGFTSAPLLRRGIRISFDRKQNTEASPVMNEQEERYLHFAYSIDSLNKAWRILNEIKRQKNNPLIGYAFRFALIEYSKPYKESRSAILDSKGRPKRKYRLATEFVPKKHLALHERIIRARDKFHAHTDLSVMDAKIYINNTKNGRVVGRSQNIIYGTEEMAKIDDIIDLIEHTLDSMYSEAKRLEENLSTDS